MAKKLKDLISAAQELNDVLGLDPEIEVEDVAEEQLILDVKESAVQIDLDNDEISKKTMDTLRAYKIPVGDEADEAAPEMNDADEMPDTADDEMPAEEEKNPAKNPGSVDKVEKGKKKGSGNVTEKPQQKKQVAKQNVGEVKDGLQKNTSVAKISQTDLIRKLLRKKAKKESIVNELMATFEKPKCWAENRFKMYETAYGQMGETDSKL